MTMIRLWHETEPREVVAEFMVMHEKTETIEQERERKLLKLPVPMVSYTVVVVR